MRSSALPALSSRGGVPRGEEECQIPSMLNPSCVGGPGSGAVGRWLVRKMAAVGVRSSKGELRWGAWPAVTASTGGCVNRRHARSNCRAKWGGAVVLEVGGGVRVGAVTGGARHAPVAGGMVLAAQQPHGMTRWRASAGTSARSYARRSRWEDQLGGWGRISCAWERAVAAAYAASAAQAGLRKSPPARSARMRPW